MRDYLRSLSEALLRVVPLREKNERYGHLKHDIDG